MKNKFAKTMKCVSCSGTMKRNIRLTTYTYKDHSIILQQPGWYCTSCDEVVLGLDDIVATEDAFIALVKKVQAAGLGSHKRVKIINKNKKNTQSRS